MRAVGSQPMERESSSVCSVNPLPELSASAAFFKVTRVSSSGTWPDADWKTTERLLSPAGLKAMLPIAWK